MEGFFGALLMALIVGAIFFYGLGRRGPWGTFWTFLLVLFFAAWAGSLWLQPIGPVFWGYAWLPLLFWVFIVALLISVAAGEDRSTSRYDQTSKTDATKTNATRTEVTEAEAGTAVALGLFFWILLGFLIVAILIGLLT